jgi:indolepyruvate ferredoxin oxidoreductase beta subunit
LKGRRAPRGEGNVFLAGVGGQGILLASEIICEALLLGGYDVKKSEVHGMAQRGGAVTTHLRYGAKVRSPLIEPGTADLLIAFEKMEALRFLHFLKEGGTILVSTQEIHPPAVSTGQALYPERIEERLKGVAGAVFTVDALGAALSLREARAANVVMVGAASHFLPLPEGLYAEALRARLPEAIYDVNVRALGAGRSLLAGSGARRAGSSA